MYVLGCKEITKSYGIDVILEDITFSLNEGEKLGLIGKNGAGKSTLFKIISGEISQDSGEVFIDKSKRVGYLSQYLSLEGDRTVYEEMLTEFQELINMERQMKTLEEKMKEPYDETNASYHQKVINDFTTLQEMYTLKGGYTYHGEISKVLKGLSFTSEDFDKPISILSGGQKTRVALCKLLLNKSDVLLLDEPTNHLDLEAIQWLEEYLKNYKGTMVIISHDRFFLDAITSKTMEVFNGSCRIYNGNYTKAMEERKVVKEAELKKYLLQQEEIKRQEEIIKKFKSFNREKSVRAAESRQKVLDKIERVKMPLADGKAAKITFETSCKSGNDVLYIENLSKAFGDKTLFNNLNLDIKKGDKIALIGENGRGKTTLFNIVRGIVPKDSGVLALGKNVNIGYYDQEQSNLNLEKSVIDEVWDEFPELTTTEIRTALAAFLFMGEEVFKEISLLSGGEKCRINLLKLMLSQSNFLLLDEPTNHLDIPSREALEDALLGYDGTLLVISHDRYFLNKVIHKIYNLEESGVTEYLGNYSYFIEKKNNPHRFEHEEIFDGKTKTQIVAQKKKIKASEREKREMAKRLKAIEKSISDLEEEIEALNGDLCLEEVYSNPEKSIEVTNSIKANEEELSKLYEEWEELDCQMS